MIFSSGQNKEFVIKWVFHCSSYNNASCGKQENYNVTCLIYFLTYPKFKYAGKTKNQILPRTMTENE